MATDHTTLTNVIFISMSATASNLSIDFLLLLIILTFRRPTFAWANPALSSSILFFWAVMKLCMSSTSVIVPQFCEIASLHFLTYVVAKSSRQTRAVARRIKQAVATLWQQPLYQTWKSLITTGLYTRLHENFSVHSLKPRRLRRLQLTFYTMYHYKTSLNTSKTSIFIYLQYHLAPCFVVLATVPQCLFVSSRRETRHGQIPRNWLQWLTVWVVMMHWVRVRVRFWCIEYTLAPIYF